MNPEELKKLASEFITKVLDSVGQKDIVVTSSVEEDDTNVTVNLQVDGEEVDLLIGYHGRNLSAIHQVVLLYLKKVVGKTDKRLMLQLDIGDYYSKQNEKVIQLAQEAISDVRLLQEPYEFRPMAPRVRRIVHMEIQKHPDIRSESIGEGEERRVVIYPNNAETTPTAE